MKGMIRKNEILFEKYQYKRLFTRPGNYWDQDDFETQEDLNNKDPDVLSLL